MTLRKPGPEDLAKLLGDLDYQVRDQSRRPMVTWDNIRADRFTGTTNAAGNLGVAFAEPFETTCLQVLLQVHSGGWFGYINSRSPGGFNVWVSELGGTSHVGSTTVEYLAVGY